MTHPSRLEKWLTHNLYQFVVPHDEPHLIDQAADGPQKVE
jgi:hypothetical protein